MPSEPTAASSLMSSRWSRDNLVTSHPARLYDGRVAEPIELESLEYLVRDLQQTRGPCQLGSGRMGVLTWDIACEGADGPFTLQLPRALDEPGRRGRSKREVPRRNAEHMRGFIERGLSRFVSVPLAQVTLGGHVPGALFEALPHHRTLTFGHGSAQVELLEAHRSWVMGLGPRATAELLCEIVAALVYHYEPDLEGGTAVADVCINDGDFAVRRRRDGSFELKLLAVRAREAHIGPSLLLLYLIQLMGYEDFEIDGSLTGLPILLGNPSIAFEGLRRGLRYRYRDLGLREELGLKQGEAWISDFGRSAEGRGYRGYCERFLAGDLPPVFGADLREHWWRLMPLQTKLGIAELAAKGRPESPEARSAKALRAFHDRLSSEIGRVSVPGLPSVNDATRDELLGLLEQTPERELVASELLERWPYRSLDQLLSVVPAARSLRRMKSRISFGRVLSHADEGKLASFPESTATSRDVANAELFNVLTLPASTHTAAAATFSSFESYVDTALHDPSFGYYAKQVVIGKRGHFDTHPEEHSPAYGAWVARCAFKAWCDLIAQGELTEHDPFPVIELGAGNGRLARDFVDAIAQNAADLRFRTFATRVEYRVYEISLALREKQRALLGAAATVVEGDARAPGAALDRDFPNGITGLVLSNELPDAFGVHKLRLGADGNAQVALVVPRLEPSAKLDAGLAQHVERENRRLREEFALARHPDDFYLSAATYLEVMRNFAGRADLLSALWFEEAYVPIAVIPELAAHLRDNAAQYAMALAAEPSGVVMYVNLHACRFMREVGARLRAGFVLTLDYGDTTWGLIEGARRGEFPFRVYGSWEDYVPRPNDPYNAPGTQDLTADVNFTDLAQAGESAGLKVVHYGPERDITGDELPELLRRHAERDALTRFLGNPVFKLLVLGTHTSDVFRSPLASPLPLLTREQAVPKARRSAIASIRSLLSG